MLRVCQLEPRQDSIAVPVLTKVSIRNCLPEGVVRQPRFGCKSMQVSFVVRSRLGVYEAIALALFDPREVLVGASFRQRIWMQNLVQDKDIRLSSANVSDDLVEVVLMVGRAPAMDVPLHQPDLGLLRSGARLVGIPRGVVFDREM